MVSIGIKRQYTLPPRNILSSGVALGPQGSPQLTSSARRSNSKVCTATQWTPINHYDAVLHNCDYMKGTVQDAKQQLLRGFRDRKKTVHTRAFISHSPQKKTRAAEKPQKTGLVADEQVFQTILKATKQPHADCLSFDTLKSERACDLLVLHRRPFGSSGQSAAQPKLLQPSPSVQSLAWEAEFMRTNLELTKRSAQLGVHRFVAMNSPRRTTLRS